LFAKKENEKAVIARSMDKSRELYPTTLSFDLKTWILLPGYFMLMSSGDRDTGNSCCEIESAWTAVREVDAIGFKGFSIDAITLAASIRSSCIYLNKVEFMVETADC
jgi:hypothetical protein